MGGQSPENFLTPFGSVFCIFIHLQIHANAHENAVSDGDDLTQP